MIIDTNSDLLFSISKKNQICCIYMITSPSGKKYIGQTVNIYWRLYKYSRLHCDKQRKLYNSFKKYGWDKHTFEIVRECKKEELDELEVHYISLYNTFNNEEGLNLISGGNRPEFSDETKEKLRLANTGKRYSKETNFKKGAGHRGKKLSIETKLKMSIAQSNQSSQTRAKRSVLWSGEKNPMFGTRWTDEQKKAHGDKIRGEKHPLFGKKHLPETIEKIKETKKNISIETREKISIAKKGKKLSEEHIENIWIGGIKRRNSGEPILRQSHKKELHPRWGKGKPVIQFTMEGIYLKEFPSPNSAARGVGNGNGNGGTNISKCCDKKISYAYGYKWEYKV